MAEKAHLLWNNEHIINLIAQNRQTIIPIIIPALERNTQKHWNNAILNLTSNVKKLVHDMDEELVLACQLDLKEEQSRSIAAAEKRKLAWEQLENVATPQLVSTTVSFLVEPATCAVTG